MKRFGLSEEIEKVFQDEYQKVTRHQILVEKIERQLESFEKILKHEFEKNEFIDKATAQNALTLSRRLIDQCKKSPEAEFVPWALAAVNYFIEVNDANNDFEEIDGFDDDIEVLKSVGQHFKLFD